MSDYELTLYTEPMETDEDVVYIELSGSDEQMKGVRQNGIEGASPQNHHATQGAGI